MEKLDFDVIICGGGPGGSTCALGFVDTNIRVAVIEKSNFPREKVCGDGMAPYIPKALNLISPKFKQAFDQFAERIPISHVYMKAFNGRVAHVAFKEPWFISSRYHFDNFLYTQASALPNVTYFLEEQVTQVNIAENIVSVETDKKRQLQAKLIIGCDGATSIVRRQLTQYKLDPEYTCAAVRAYFSGVKDIMKDTFEFHFVPKYPNGYFWVFPSEGDQTNIGFGMMTHDVAHQKLKLRDVLLEIIDDDPKLKERFKEATLTGDIKGWSIPFAYGKHPISGNRFMLVGDAASVADPMSGEGIGQAIVTGRIAASQAKACFDTQDFSAQKLKEYDAAVDKKWGKIIRLRRKYANLVAKYPWTMNSVIGLLSTKGKVSEFTRQLILKLVS
jgi:geranylgeranyl reductase family protein